MQILDNNKSPVKHCFAPPFSTLPSFLSHLFSPGVHAWATTKQVALKERDEAFAEALAGVRKGHGRLEVGVSPNPLLGLVHLFLREMMRFRRHKRVLALFFLFLAYCSHHFLPFRLGSWEVLFYP